MVTAYKMVGVAELKMTGLLAPYFLGTIIVLGGVLIFSKSNPYQATGISLTLGALATLGYLMIEMNKLLPVKFPGERVVLSLIYALPMMIFAKFSYHMFPSPTVGQSLAVLLLLGFYQLACQIILAKEWILKGKKYLSNG